MQDYIVKIIAILVLLLSTLNLSNSYARYCVVSGGLCIFPESQQEQEDDTDYYLLIAGGILGALMISEMSSTNFTSDTEADSFNYNPLLGVNFAISDDTNINLLRWGPSTLGYKSNSNLEINEIMNNINLFEITHSFHLTNKP